MANENVLPPNAGADINQLRDRLTRLERGTKRPDVLDALTLVLSQPAPWAQAKSPVNVPAAYGSVTPASNRWTYVHSSSPWVAESGFVRDSAYSLRGLRTDVLRVEMFVSPDSGQPAWGGQPAINGSETQVRLRIVDTFSNTTIATSDTVGIQGRPQGSGAKFYTLGFSWKHGIPVSWGDSSAAETYQLIIEVKFMLAQAVRDATDANGNQRWMQQQWFDAQVWTPHLAYGCMGSSEAGAGATTTGAPYLIPL